MKDEKPVVKTQKATLSKLFANPLLKVDINTGEIIVDRIEDKYLKNL